MDFIFVISYNGYLCMQENISGYINGCRCCGVDDSHLFDTVDLLEQRNIKKVCCYGSIIMVVILIFINIVMLPESPLLAHIAGIIAGYICIINYPLLSTNDTTHICFIFCTSIIIVFLTTSKMLHFSFHSRPCMMIRELPKTRTRDIHGLLCCLLL